MPGGGGVRGPGSTLAAQMAVEDSGLTAKGWKIDIIAGDHQNKPDIGVNIVRQWFDVDKVDVIVDVPNSGVALAVSNLVKEKNGVFLNSGAGTSDLTNAQCTPNTIHWTYDTYTLAHGTGTALGDVVEVEAQSRHLELPVRMPPIGPRTIAVDLDAIPVRVREVERLADEMIRCAVKRPARDDQAGQGERQILARGDEDRQVIEAGGASVQVRSHAVAA